MSEWTWVVYDKLDLELTSPLGVFTDLSERECLVPWDGTGSGSFVINRHSSQMAWCATRNYITVHIGDEGDPAVFGFFIEEGADVIVSHDEEGGETFKRGGRGSLIYLERAIVDHVQRTANAFTIDDDKMNLVWTDKTVGKILRDLIDEAQARTPDPLPDVTVDFTGSLDSNGDPWDVVEDEFNIPIGLDLLSAIETLKGQGLTVHMDPDFTLHGYQDWTAAASGVTFEKGVNIREAAEREVHATTAKSRMLVQGTRKNGTTIYKTATDPSVIEDEGVFEGFMRYNRNATVARLEKAGQRQLRSLKRLHDGSTTVGVTVGDGTAGPRGTGAGHYVPFTDYSPGESIVLDVPGEYESLVKMLGGIILEDTEAGEYDPSIVFDVPDYNPGVGEMQPGGGGPSGGPPFAGDQEPGVGVGVGTAAELGTGTCVTGDPRAMARYDAGGGAGVQYSLGGTNSGDDVGSWVYNNVPWTDGFTPGGFGCPIGGGSWKGWNDEEIWVEFTAPADDPTEFLGLQTTLDLSALSISGSVFGYWVKIASGALAATRWGEGTFVAAPSATTGTVIITIPRSFVDWGATNSLIVTPAWLCVHGTQFCNDMGYFGNPHADGRANSGSYSGFGFDDICTVSFVVGTGGFAPWVPGYGNVDGANAEFNLIHWTGSGAVEAQVNGLTETVASVDTGAFTATLATPPPAGSTVTFKYEVSA